MAKYKVWLPALLVGLALCLSSGPAQAWELDMKGNFDWEYRFLTQTGPNGFFGAYNHAALANAGGAASILNQTGSFAPYNFWAGWNRRAGIVSGSDAEWATQYMDSFITIKINPALQIRGWYRIGEWARGAVANNPAQPLAAGDLGVGDNVASEYLTYSQPGVQRSFSPGYWNYLFMTAQVPWGILNFGKRRSSFGMGLGWNGEDSRSSESVSVSVLYGPFNMSLGFYPARRGLTSGPGIATTPVGNVHNAPGYFNRDRDKNAIRDYDASLFIAYRTGEIDLGAQANWGPHFGAGGEGVIDTPANRGTNYVYVTDHAEFYGGAYVKFNNGRFFFNGEVDWFQSVDKTSGAKPNFVIGRGDVAGINIRNTSIDHWRYAAEIGFFGGPSKVSGLFAWLSGGDRRGTAGGLVGQIDNNGILRSSSFANTGMFRPYSYLINEVYGSGVFQNGDTTKGYIEDAIIYAARLDYAVAANLNVSGSFMWADRNSKSGFGWGVIRPDSSATPGSNIGQITNGNIFTLLNNENTPNIPDTNLGYEIDAGMDWKLLEGFTLNLTGAYWQPGKWFVWACRDKNIAGWGSDILPGTPALTPLAAFVNPTRTIDPVWGIEFKVQGDF